MITTRSSYDQVVTEINAGVEDCVGDSPELDRDQAFADIAESLLYDASEKVAREICRCELGFVPQALERLWKSRKEAAAAAAKQREQAKREAKREAKLQAARDAEAAELQRMRDSRCPRCFVVRSPAGACNCV